jgi:hypothetical protein
VVLKQDSNYYEHFYKDLKPWVHYIPFQRDLSDLEEKLKWAIDNDDKVKNIYSSVLLISGVSAIIGQFLHEQSLELIYA